MKKCAFILFLGITLVSCSSDDSVLEAPETVAEIDAIRTFIFGHSLIVHEPPAIPTPSDETSVPHWMASFTRHTGQQYAVAGQYGFLEQHAQLPPVSQWGFDLATPAWDSDVESFGAADFNTVLITPANFIQWQGPGEDYYQSDISPVDATITIADWVTDQEPNVTVYIYENWPDMAPYIEGALPTAQELADYHTITRTEFHDWWIDYHDLLLEERPGLNIRMIPVGPILGKILSETDLSNISIENLYEDDAPHGRPTIYFLAGLVTYMAMYQQELPADYPVPDTVDELVGEHLEEVIEMIWNELNAFNFTNGESRVW